MTPKYVFFEGEFVEWDAAKIHVTTHAFLYGSAVFGGIRGYWNEEDKQLYMFRLPDHFSRLHDSAHIIFIKLEYGVERLIEITRELVRKNEFNTDVYVRPLAYKGIAPRIIGVGLSGVPDKFCMFAFPFGDYVDTKKGLRVCTSSWRRIDDNVIPSRGKISGGYINSGLAKTEAVLNGFDDCIMLTKNGFISEGSGMNLCIVRKGTVITTPVFDDILEGIVRRSILEIAADLGYATEVRSISRTELYVCDEAFFCGTGAQVALIAEIDHRAIKNPDHPISSKIQEVFFETVRGKNKKYKHWLTGVY